MLQNFILAVCQLAIAFLMLAALIVFIFAVREAALSLYEYLAACSRRRQKYKLDRRQSHQFKEFHDGPKHP